MKILLFGARGQVGWQLQRSLATLGEIVALDRSSTALCGDLADAEGIARAVATVQPQVVVNAAAYTAVDKAEDDAELAFAINARACEALARASSGCGAWLVHYSSDYVYDGSGMQPWRETDAPAPLSAYGRSKLAGDESVVRGNPRHLVLRTSWVFDSWGQNFARSILKAACSRDELKIVADQWGAPTRAALIADITAAAIRQTLQASAPLGLAGIYHLAASGFTTWHEYAMLLVEEGRRAGLPLRVDASRVHPIPTSGYPTRAARPANSRLDTGKLRRAFGLWLPPWQDGVRAVVAELARQRDLPGS
jgi:dTDP-4-dehydrorhamnose reductase